MPRPDRDGARNREDPTVPARPTPVRSPNVVQPLDEEDMAATQRVAFEPADLGMALDEIEASFEAPAVTTRGAFEAPAVTTRGAFEASEAPAVTTRGASAEVPVRDPLPHLEDPALPVASKTPQARPTPLSPYATAAPPVVRHVSESVVQLGEAATSLATMAEAPTPKWVLPYLVVCAVLTVMGLGVLWLEYRTVGNLLLR